MTKRKTEVITPPRNTRAKISQADKGKDKMPEGESSQRRERRLLFLQGNQSEASGRPSPVGTTSEQHEEDGLRRPVGCGLAPQGAGLVIRGME